MPKGKDTMVPAQLANLEKGKFQPGQSGNPAGRKKDRVKALLKEVLSKASLRKATALSNFEIDTIEQTVLALELPDLQLIAKYDKTPAYMKTLAMAMIIDMKNGQTKTVDLLRSRQYGTPKQNIDVTTAGAPLNQTSLTQEQAKQLIADLEEDY